MKKIAFYFTFFLILFTYCNVYALNECTTSEMTRLKELANNVKFNVNSTILESSLEDEELNPVYDIDILNFDESLRISYKSVHDDELQTITSETTKIDGFMEGDKVTFYIYAYTNNMCIDELLKTVTVDLPVYNAYYYFNKDKCSTHKDFKYCQEFLDVDISFEEIDKLYDEYLKKEENVLGINKNNLIWYIVGGSVLIVAISIGTIVILKKRKNKDDI